MNQKIYFDNGSTSWPKAPQVASSMSELLESGAFNINRGNYEGAYELESLVLLTRMQLARLFHAPDSRHVIFTPGITYSLNYLIKGLLSPGDHVLVSSLEHNAVMRPLCQLASQDIHRREAALIMHWIQSRICGSQQKIRSLRSMTIHSKIFSRKSLTKIMPRSSKKPELHISIL